MDPGRPDVRLAHNLMSQIIYNVSNTTVLRSRSIIDYFFSTSAIVSLVMDSGKPDVRLAHNLMSQIIYNVSNTSVLRSRSIIDYFFSTSAIVSLVMDSGKPDVRLAHNLMSQIIYNVSNNDVNTGYFLLSLNRRVSCKEDYWLQLFPTLKTYQCLQFLCEQFNVEINNCALQPRPLSITT